MNSKKSFSQKMEEFLAGKGFYIVLFLCVAVIGATAWVLFFTGDNGSDDQNSGMVYNPNPSMSVEVTDDGEDYQSTIGDAELENPALDDLEPDDTTTETEPSEEELSDVPSPADEVINEANKVFIWPISGEIILPYSVSELIYDQTMGDWRVHRGIDLEAETGAKVMAVSSGTVESIYFDELYGTTVVINHGNELCSIYSNLAKSPPVSVGDTVSAGDTIGTIGDTAIVETGVESHLHFEMSKDKENISPLEYLPTT